MPDTRRASGGWVWKLAGYAVRTYYRIERNGEPLPAGPLLLVANHPNTLVDPALIQATAGCGIRFLAKSTLFAGHPLSWLVRASGAIPTYRKMDAGVDTSRNVEMFAAVKAALAAGEAVCLFPEGISHSEGRLEPLRTGAARMALDSNAGGCSVTIVPVGLNFDDVARFRSRVTVVFGRAFDAADLTAAYAADAQAAVRTLTDRIRRRLRRLMVEAEPRHDLPLVIRIDRLYSAARGVARDSRERIARRRVIAAGMAQLRERAPERLVAIAASVSAYDADLARFGLRDRDIDRDVSFKEAAWFAVREGLLALVLLPLTALSLAFFAVPYQLTALVTRFAPDLKSRAIWAVCAGGVAYGAWTGAIGGLVAWATSVTGGLLASAGVVALAFGGVAAYERERAVLRLARAFFALRQTPLAARARLRRQRAALADVLDQAHKWLEAGAPGGSRQEDSVDSTAQRPD